MTQESAVATNDAGQTLKLTATPDNIDVLAGGASTVLVELYAEDGSPIEGASVVLTSTIGKLDSNKLTTDADGVAIATLAATGMNGYAAIVATYRSMQAMVSVDFWNGSPNGSAESGGGVDVGGDDGGGDDTAA